MGQVDFSVYLAVLFPEVDGSRAHGTLDAGVGLRDADNWILIIRYGMFKFRERTFSHIFQALQTHQLHK